MRTPIRIVVRTNTDWRGMGAAEFAAQGGPIVPTRWIRFTAAKDVFALWDAAFDIDFFTYRAEVRDIAVSSLTSAGADLISIGLDDFPPYGGFDRWWDTPDDELLVPIDDDDLFQPDLGALPGEFGDGIDLVLWPQSILSFNEHETSLAFRWAPLPLVLETNCALRKSFVTSHFSRDDAKEMLAHHPIANEKIADALGVNGKTGFGRFRFLDHPRIKFIAPSFGLYNAHVGSISFLANALRRDDPLDFLTRLDFAVPRPVPDYVASLTAHVDALEGLWRSMRRAR
jgi:hypothetical protein